MFGASFGNRPFNSFLAVSLPADETFRYYIGWNVWM